MFSEQHHVVHANRDCANEGGGVGSATISLRGRSRSPSFKPFRGVHRSNPDDDLLLFLQKQNCVCVFITAGPIIKLCAGGEGDSEGHVL
jgi:hypothetical protein